MQLHEGLGLVLKDPEAEISVMKLHPYGIWRKTLLWEASIKL
jgi:hypothetical protein